MKHLATLFLILITSNIFAQEKFLDPKKIWSEAFIECLPQGNKVTSSWYRISEKTKEKDGNIYHIVETSTDPHADEWYESDVLLREDGPLVYMRENYSDEKEGLIYDWSIEVGDQVELENFLINSELKGIVKSIETKDTPWGPRKFYTIRDNYDISHDVWVEGMGSISGLIHSGNYLLGLSCGNYEYICMENDGELFMHNEKFEECFVNGWESIAELESLGIQIYPNPTQDKLIFHSSQNQMQLHLYSIRGEMILSQKMEQGNNQLDLSQAKAGIYILEITTKEGRSLYHKICKQN